MNNSIFIARVMGLYLLILSLSLLINAKSFAPMITNLFQNGALLFVVGMMLLLVGTLLVISHNIWRASWVVVITILAWLILIKGILYLIFPGLLQSIAQQVSYSNTGIYVGVAINLLISLFLCYKGFIASSQSNRK